MAKESELLNAVITILERIDEVNTLYIQKIATQILKIGELNPTSMHRLAVMSSMYADINEITQKLSDATALNIKDVHKLLDDAANDTRTDPRFKAAIEANPETSNEAWRRVKQYTEYVVAQTAGNLVNLSNTTAISEPYQQAVDRAIYAVSTGLGDYRSEMRSVIKQIGYNGMQVYYESGYHRRLDTAVRQNIIDGSNQIAQNASLMMGEALGYDAVELSAHARSAPDHEPVQGRVFTLEQFARMQRGDGFTDVDGNRYQGFRRPIGEWNCMHLAMSFSTTGSVRRYTDRQLKAWQEANASGCDVGDKHYSIYEAVQTMRRIETEVRRQKDVAVAAAAAKDEELRITCQKRINALVNHYADIANASGITPSRDRMTVEGFRAIKVK